jgi:hypothetical protein
VPIALHEDGFGHEACVESEKRMMGARGVAAASLLLASVPGFALEAARWQVAEIVLAEEVRPVWYVPAMLGLHALAVPAAMLFVLVFAVLYAKTRPR